MVPRTEPLSKDGTPDWAYDEDGYCVSCGNGNWKHHMPECELRDALDALQVVEGRDNTENGSDVPDDECCGRVRID